LVRPRLVIDAGVDHAAVVTRLVAPEARLLLDHSDATTRKVLGERQCRRQTDNPAADDSDVVGAVTHGGRSCNTPRYAARKGLLLGANGFCRICEPKGPFVPSRPHLLRGRIEGPPSKWS